MSGSSILSETGAAIGALVTSGCAEGEEHTDGGPQPRLAYHLSAGILEEITRLHR
jgi:hypothetical protein